MGEKEFNKKGFVFFIVFLILAIIGIGILTSRGKKKNGKNDNSKIETAENEPTYYQTLEDGTKLNNSTELNKEREYKGLKISNIQLTEKNGMSLLLADVENTSGKDIGDFTDIDITFYDSNKNKIGTTEGLIIPLKAGAKTQLNASVTFNYSNAYTFEITEHK